MCLHLSTVLCGDIVETYICDDHTVWYLVTFIISPATVHVVRKLPCSPRDYTTNFISPTPSTQTTVTDRTLSKRDQSNIITRQTHTDRTHRQGGQVNSEPYMPCAAAYVACPPPVTASQPAMRRYTHATIHPCNPPGRDVTPLLAGCLGPRLQNITSARAADRARPCWCRIGTPARFVLGRAWRGARVSVRRRLAGCERAGARAADFGRDPLHVCGAQILRTVQGRRGSVDGL